MSWVEQVGVCLLMLGCIMGLVGWWIAMQPQRAKLAYHDWTAPNNGGINVFKELPRDHPKEPHIDEEVQAWLHMRSLNATFRHSGQLWSLHSQIEEPFMGFLVMLPAYADLSTWRAAMDAYDCGQRIKVYQATLPEACTISSP